MPAVVIDVETSRMMGSGSARIPAAIGLGVMTGVVPPEEAT